MGPLVLAKNFPAVVDENQTFVSDWLPMDSEFQNGTIHVHCQTISPNSGVTTGFEVQVETSYDTVESNQIGTTINVIATGSSNSAISANIAAMVRLKIENSETFPMFGILSVWLQPKSE